MIGVFPVSDEIRARIERHKGADCQQRGDVQASAAVVIPLHDSFDDYAYRLQRTAAATSARTTAVILLMPTLHELLSSDPLVSCPSTMTGQDDDGKKADV